MKNIRIPLKAVLLLCLYTSCTKKDLTVNSSTNPNGQEEYIASSATVQEAQSSQTQTTVSGKNAYVHLPADYSSTTVQYPILIFFPGLGESSGDATELLKYGPSKFINDGHKMEFVVNGVTEKLIVISVQPGDWASQTTIETIVNSILSNGVSGILSASRIDPSRVYLTGLSAGGWEVENYITGKQTNASKITAVVVSHSVQTDNSLSQVRYFAESGGKWWGVEGANDMRGMDNFRDAMNSSVAGSARYTLISSGQTGSTHCCWNTFYDPNWTTTGESFYTWLLKQRKGSSSGQQQPVNQSPVANAGSNQTITLPTNSVTLNGSGSDPDGSITAYSWTKISGPSQITIQSPSSPSTVVSNLVQGVYTLQLRVTDNKGATGTSNVTITVNSSSSTPPPPSGTTTRVQAENYTAMKGVEIRNEGGTTWVADISNTDWMDYNINLSSSGTKTITFMVSAPSSSKQLQVLNASGAVLATVNLPRARWWGDWTTVSTNINLPSGAQKIRIYASNAPFDFDWFEIR